MRMSEMVLLCWEKREDRVEGGICFVIWMPHTQFDTKILATDFQDADEIALLQMNYL